MGGWLFLGLPGALCVGGMNSVWIGVGLVIGAYLNWQFLARRLLVFTEVAKDSITLPDYLENRFNDTSRILRGTSALVIEVFYKQSFRKQASQKKPVWISRTAVIVIALIAIAMASNPDSKVLGLVAYAWGGFGAAFGPVIILSVFWKRMLRNGTLVGMIMGAATIIAWKQIQGGIFDIYENLPGFGFCFLSIIIVSLLDKAPDETITLQFDKF